MKKFFIRERGGDSCQNPLRSSRSEATSRRTPQEPRCHGPCGALRLHPDAPEEIERLKNPPLQYEIEHVLPRQRKEPSVE
jgi:hypothetical protein